MFFLVKLVSEVEVKYILKGPFSDILMFSRIIGKIKISWRFNLKEINRDSCLLKQFLHYSCKPGILSLVVSVKTGQITLGLAHRQSFTAIIKF